MEAYVEPICYISDLEDYHDGKGPHYVISIPDDDAAGDQIRLSDPESQDWDWTELIKWCVENFNGKYKIVMSDFGDFFIEVYDQDDAFAFKMRWT